jgi:hypothetical protein
MDVFKFISLFFSIPFSEVHETCRKRRLHFAALLGWGQETEAPDHPLRHVDPAACWSELHPERRHLQQSPAGRYNNSSKIE